MRTHNVWTPEIQQAHQSRVVLERKAQHAKELLSIADKNCSDAKHALATSVATFDALFSEECKTIARVWSKTKDQPEAEQTAKKIETVWTAAIQDAHNSRITAEAQAILMHRQHLNAHYFSEDAQKELAQAVQEFHTVFDKQCDQDISDQLHRKRQKNDSAQPVASGASH